METKPGKLSFFVKNMKKFLFVFFLLLLFTRFYNLEYTARYTEDESGFLVRVHQIFVEKKVTLVGQINDQGTKVFSSLSVYLLLPSAILFNFDPVGVFYGAAFFGVLTGLILLYLAKIINKKLIVLSALLILSWFPLVQIGRWAWNPNFLPMWIALGIIFHLQKKYYWQLLAGICFGLAVHQHYYSIFAVGFFTVMVSIKFLLKKELKKAILINLGLVLMIVPFVIFDLRHPPGIFLLGASNQVEKATLGLALANFLKYSADTFVYHTQSLVLGKILAIAVLLLAFLDIKKRAMLYFIPCIAQAIALSIIAPYFPHYFYPLIPFFFVWIISPRTGARKYIALLIIGILIIAGLTNLPRLLTTSPVNLDLTTLKTASATIENEIQRSEIKNANVTVLKSPNENTYGKKIRDLLLVSGKVKLKTSDEYSITDNLFVVSPAQEQDLRSDSATEIDNFKNGVVRQRWILNDRWNLYLFNK